MVGAEVSAQTLVSTLTSRGFTLATAESLTAGLVAATIADVPGASATLQGGTIAYHSRVKHAVLGVEAELLAERGAVDEDVALAMADGARRLYGADFGVATTGVAGPEPHEGKPVGTVVVAATADGAGQARSLRLSGARAEIRAATVSASLALLSELVDALPR